MTGLIFVFMFMSLPEKDFVKQMTHQMMFQNHSNIHSR